MANKIKITFSLLILILFSSLLCDASIFPSWRKDDKDKKSILLVSSYNIRNPWVDEFLGGFLPTLSDDTYIINTVELGVRTTPNFKPRVEDANSIISRTKEQKTDLIVALDLPAINLLKEIYPQINPETNILLAGYVGEIDSKFVANKNVFAVKKTISFKENLSLIQKLYPNIRSVNVITDASLEGVTAHNYLKSEFLNLRSTNSYFEEKTSHINLEFINGNYFSTGEMLKTISQEDDVVLYFSWASIKDEHPINQNSIETRIFNVANGRVFSFFSAAKKNSIGGFSIGGVDFGVFCAGKVKEILEKKLVDIDVEFTFDPILKINIEAFNSANLDFSSLPPETIFVKKTDGIWQTFGKEIVIGILAFFLLFAFLFSILIFRVFLITKRNSILFSNLPSNTYVFSEDGTIIYAYSEYAHLRNIKSILHFGTEFFPKFLEALPEIKAGKRISITYRFENVIRKAVISKLPETSFGSDAYISNTMDITDLEKAKREALENSLHLETTLNSIGDGVIATDENEIITFMNPISCALTGYTKQEAVGKHLDDVFNIVSYLNDAKVVSPIKTSLKTREISLLSAYTDLISKDGKRYHIADSAAPIINNGKLTGAILVFRDVTEENKKRDEIIAKNTFLSAAVNMARITYFKSDNKFNIIGDFDSKFFGADNKEDSPTLHEFVDPRDLDYTMQAVDAFLKSNEDSFSCSFRSNYNGKLRYIHCNVIKDKSEFNQKKEYLVVLQDVSEAKKQEEKLQDANKFLKNIFDNIPGAICVKNASDGGKYIMVNTPFEEMLGIKAEEIIGKSSEEIFGSAEALALENSDKYLIQTGKKIEEDIKVTRRDGKDIFVHRIKTREIMENGDILIFTAALDTTEIIKNQKALKIQSEQMSVINKALQYSIRSDNNEETLQEILSITGTNLNSDRAFIFILNQTEDKYLNLANWFPKDAEKSALNLPEIESDMISDWFKEFEKHNIVKSYDLSSDKSSHLKLPHEILVNQNVKSFMVTGIFENEKPIGFLGVDNINRSKVFEKNDEVLLESIARVAELTIEKYRNKDKAASEERIRRLILDSLPLPVMLFDANRSIISVNSAATKMCERSAEEILSRPCYESFCKGANTDETCLVRRVLDTKESQSLNIHSNDKDLIAQATPIFDNQGKVKYVIEVSIDTTQLNEANRRLESALHAAQDADKAKSNFLATMSHELRTPLNAVIGYSELTQDPSLNLDERLHNLRSINFAAKTLLSLINDILDLSKLEANQIEICSTVLNIKEFTDEFQAVFEYSIKKKNLYFRQEIPSDMPLIKIDALRLKQILMNIIGNAIKFTKEGGVTIKVTYKVNNAHSLDMCIAVSDTGIGIEKEHLDKIFSPFVQEYTTRVRGRGAYEGTGLGLAIAKRLVEKINGSINVESVPGKGSTFTVCFKDLAIANATDAREAIIEGAVISPSSEINKLKSENLKVLVLDDILLNVKVLSKILRQMNITVIEALSGKEALEKLNTEKPDIIMTDLWMPEMDGEEFAKQVRMNPDFSDVPIIAVTADTQANLSKVFNAILLKPISIKSVAATINKFVY